MITPSFAVTASERVLPKLALDFTTANLDARITFTRATSASNPATYVNSSGVIAAASDNTARFDFDPVTLACKGLLIEESRANIFTYSDDFSNVIWVKSTAAITTDAIVSPDGTSNADKFIAAVGSGQHRLENTRTFTAAAYTTSVYAKRGELNYIWLYSAVANQGKYFDLLNGAVLGNTGNAPTSSSITPAGNGWYRCSITTTQTAASTGVFIGLSTNGTSATFSGDGTSGVYIWGAQCELGAFATSYIPTTNAALTRNADVAVMTSTNFSSWWTATTGASSVWVTPKSNSGVRPLFQVDDTTTNNFIVLRGNITDPELYIKATTDQTQIDAGTVAANTSYKLSGAWATDNCAAAQNGAAAVTDNVATIPTVTQARIGSDGTNYANSWVEKIFYWPQRLTNAEIQAFSK